MFFPTWDEGGDELGAGCRRRVKRRPSGVGLHRSRAGGCSAAGGFDAAASVGGDLSKITRVDWFPDGRKEKIEVKNSRWISERD
jgi:hypothetical protein